MAGWMFPTSVDEVTGPTFILLPTEPVTCLAVSVVRELLRPGNRYFSAPVWGFVPSFATSPSPGGVQLERVFRRVADNSGTLGGRRSTPPHSTSLRRLRARTSCRQARSSTSSSQATSTMSGSSRGCPAARTSSPSVRASRCAAPLNSSFVLDLELTTAAPSSPPRLPAPSPPPLPPAAPSRASRPASRSATPSSQHSH